MAEVTAEQVRRVREEGYRAGYALTPANPNPYAPEHVPEWQGPRTAAARTQAERAERSARILAGVWLRGHQDGRAAYARDNDLRLPSELI